MTKATLANVLSEKLQADKNVVVRQKSKKSHLAAVIATLRLLLELAKHLKADLKWSSISSLYYQAMPQHQCHNIAMPRLEDQQIASLARNLQL